MIYSKTITTLSGVGLTSIQRTTLPLTKGLIYQLDIDFPPGSAGYMGVAIFDGSFSVWPSNIGNFFTGDDIQISFPDLYLKEIAPFHLDIYTYNLDDTYDHIVNVRIGMVSKRIYMARFLPTVSWEFFSEMIAEVTIKQAEIAARQREEILKTPFSWMVEEEEGQ